MKVSEMIEDIIVAAERKFGVSDHINDTIEVSIYFNEMWQLSLRRPTQHALDTFESDDSRVLDTCKVSEDYISFRTEDSSLVSALRTLYDRVIKATSWEDGHPVHVLA